MIDKVVICGIKRGNQYITQNELLQSVGRCGRSYTSSGQAIILSTSDEYEKANQMLFGKMKPIQSVMDQVQNVGFHVLPMIAKQVVKNEETYLSWYSKTLSFIQGKNVSYDDVKRYLIENECLLFFGDNIIVSELGDISNKFYYSPQRIKMLKDRLQEVYDSNHLNNIYALSWMFGFERVIVGNVNQQQLIEYKSTLSSLGYVCTQGQLIHCYAFFCLLNGNRPKWLKYTINNEYNDLQRLINAVKKISDYIKLDIQNLLQRVIISCKKRITLKQASKMIQFGLKTKQSILQLQQFEIESKQRLMLKFPCFSEKLKKQLRENGYVFEENNN